MSAFICFLICNAKVADFLQSRVVGVEVCPPKWGFGGQTGQKNKFVHQIGHLVDKLYVCGSGFGLMSVLGSQL
jgi:hypothetical protein